ncbi:MAG: alpha/beta family hydrolase [Thermodesulfobacteriota bacterium]
MQKKEILLKTDGEKKFNCILNIPDSYSDYSAVIAHGANNDINNGLLEKTAETLSENNIPVLRFNFPYRYAGRKSPDSSKVLKKAWLQAYSFMRNHKEFPSKKMIVIGKSLGGRIAAEICAANYFSPEVMVFLGYPLHAPGKKDKVNDSPLYLIDSPMIFFSGTKDPLCSRELLENIDKKTGDKSFVYFLENAGHGLTYYKMSGEETLDHYKFLAGEIKNCIFRCIS